MSRLFGSSVSPRRSCNATRCRGSGIWHRADASLGHFARQGLCCWAAFSLVGLAQAAGMEGVQVVAAESADGPRLGTPAAPTIGTSPQFEITIAGRSLSAWRSLMNTVDLRDPARGDYVDGLLAVMKTEQVPWFTRRQAALTLARWGEPARPAIPVLITCLHERTGESGTTPQTWALRSLALFGPLALQAAEPVAALAKDPRESLTTRLLAVETLSQIGPRAPVVLPTLLSLLTAGDERPTAVDRNIPRPSHAESSPTAKAALQVVDRSGSRLEDAAGVREELRLAAVEALGVIGPAAAVAVPALVHRLDVEATVLRRSVVTALGQIGPGAAPAQPALLDCLLTDTDLATTDAARVALIATGPDIIPTLLGLLDTDDAVLRERVLQTLGGYGRRAPQSVAASLRSAWTAPEASVRLAAYEASIALNDVNRQLVERLIEAMSSDVRDERRHAVRLFERLGPVALEARTKLVALEATVTAERRSAVRKGLAHLDRLETAAATPQTDR